MKIETHLNGEKSSQIIINVVGATHQVNKITNQTTMTIEILGTDTEIVIFKINPIINTTLGQTNDIESPYPSNSSNNYRSSSYNNRSQERQNNYRNDSYRNNDRQNSRDRQSNGLPRSDNRYRDRSRDHDRDRTPARQNTPTH